MADADVALADLRDAVNMVAATLAMREEPVPVTAALSRVVSAFRALDSAAQSGRLPDEWVNWQRYRHVPHGNELPTFPMVVRRQLDAANQPPPLTRRKPGASGR